MQAVAKSIKKAKRRRNLSSLKQQKARLHRHNRRRAKQHLKAHGSLLDFEPERLTDRDIT